MTGNVTLNSGIQNVNSAKMMAAGSVSDEFQSQIAGKQQSLKRLESNSEMSAAQKERERQKIQQQIAELNRELKQQQEAEKEKAAKAAKQQEKKVALREEMLKETEKTEKTEKVASEEEQKKAEAVKEDIKNETAEVEDTTLPPEMIQELMASDFSRQQEMTQNNMAKQREQRKDILEAEMASDSIRGFDHTAKEEALSKMEKREEIIFEVQEYMNNPFEPSSGVGSGAKIIIRE